MKRHPQITPSIYTEEPPSLEQILQTIRGVIGEEELPSPSNDVLELTEMLMEDGTIISTRQSTNKLSPSDTTVSITHYTDFSSLYAHAEREKDSLLSEESATISASALQNLAHAAATAKSNTSLSSSAAFRSGQPLEDLVMEMLKPELSQWLDRHLPTLIQQVVEREIQKLLPHEK